MRRSIIQQITIAIVGFSVTFGVMYLVLPGDLAIGTLVGVLFGMFGADVVAERQMA